MLSFKDHVSEANFIRENEVKVNSGLVYELKVYTAMMSVKIPGLVVGDKPTAGFSNQGAGDLEAKLNNKPNR